MDKFVLTTGSAVAVELVETADFTAVKFQTNNCVPISYETIGEAMKAATKINQILGNPICKVIQTSVSGNL